MKSRFKLFFFCICFFSMSLQANTNKVGNGGDAVVCSSDKNSEIISAELLDFYENKNEKIEKNNIEKDPYQIAQSQFDKLKGVAPKLFKQYQNRLQQIKDEIEFKNNIKLTEIEDSLHAFQPISENCKIIQIAIKKDQVIAQEKRFLIREDLWKKMSPSHQAGLLTHEIIYEHLAKLGEVDSIKARKLNAYLYANEINKNDFWIYMKTLKVPIYP